MRRAKTDALLRARLLCAGLLSTAALLACSPESSEAPVSGSAAEPPPRLGLWAPCEGSQRVLEHPDRVSQLLAVAARLGATDLFVQIYRGGRAWFDSSLADATPYRELAAKGSDPLRDLVAAAHAQGIRVHAWGNVLSLAARRDGPLLAAVGPDAVQADREGRSVLDYPDLQPPEAGGPLVRMGTPAVWLDPGAPGVAAHLAATFGELAERYPELDGLHLDYIRYPDVLPFTPGSRFDVGLDFGFGEASRERFRKDTGLEAPFRRETRNAEAFDDWRRAQVTAVVREIAAASRASRPGLELSAAVWAYPDRAYLALHQDWTRWLDEGLLSFAVPMAYTRDPRLFTLLSRANAAIGGKRTWLGLGTWLFAATPDAAAAQLAEARALETAGVALFSYDALAESPALLEALAPTAVHER